MQKEYVITFLNLTTNKVGCDCFMGKDECEVRRAFKECYRHDSYKILSVVLTDREQKEEV